MQTDVQARGQDPGGKVGGLDAAEGGAEQDRAAVGEAVLHNLAAGPVEIGPIADDEFDLVGGSEPLEIGPVVPRSFSRGGCFQVEDDPNPRIDLGGVARSTGLQQDRETGVGEPGHQRMDFGLEQGLAAGDLDQLTRLCQFSDTIENLVGSPRLAVVESVGGIAVDAPEVASGQSDKDARHSHMGAFALKAAVDLVDDQGADRPLLQRFEPVAGLVRGERLDWGGEGGHRRLGSVGDLVLDVSDAL